MADRLKKQLLAAGWIFGVASLIHIVDHLRRGQGSVSEPLYWAGNAALIVQVAVVTLLLTNHRQAPRWAAVAGFTLAGGFFAAHWLPEWSALSDPVWEIETWTWFSAFASSAEILAALALGVAAVRVLRRRDQTGQA